MAAALCACGHERQNRRKECACSAEEEGQPRSNIGTWPSQRPPRCARHVATWLTALAGWRRAAYLRAQDDVEAAAADNFGIGCVARCFRLNLPPVCQDFPLFAAHWLPHVLTRSKGRFSEVEATRNSSLRDSLRDSSPPAGIDAKHTAFEVRHCNTAAISRLQAVQTSTKVLVLLSTRTRVPLSHKCAQDLISLYMYGVALRRVTQSRTRLRYGSAILPQAAAACNWTNKPRSLCCAPHAHVCLRVYICFQPLSHKCAQELISLCVYMALRLAERAR